MESWNNTTTSNKSLQCFAEFDTITIYLMTHVCLILAILGMVANIFTMVVLHRDTEKKTTRYLLLVLAAEDFALIVFNSTYYIINNYGEVYRIASISYNLHFDTVNRFLISWVKMTEIYTIVLVSLDRYIAITYPLKAASLCRVSKARRILFIISTVSFIVKLPILIFEYQTAIPIEGCIGKLKLKLYFNITDEIKEMFDKYYVFGADQIVAYVIPLISLIVLNACLIRRIRDADSTRNALNGSTSMGSTMRLSACTTPRLSLQMSSPILTTGGQRRPTSDIIEASTHLLSIPDRSGRMQQNGTGKPHQCWKRRRRNNVTFTLISIVSIFILCETPTSIQIFLNLSRSEDPSHTITILVQITYSVALICIYINCASNFFVYVLIGRKFRNQFLDIFCRHCYTPRCRRRLPGPTDMTVADEANMSVVYNQISLATPMAYRKGGYCSTQYNMCTSSTHIKENSL